MGRLSTVITEHGDQKHKTRGASRNGISNSKKRRDEIENLKPFENWISNWDQKLK